MPQTNMRGGKNHRRGKKREDIVTERTIYASEHQVYGMVLSRSGGKRLMVDCSDSQKRSAVIPGKFYKRVWFDKGDIVLCDLDVLGEHNTGTCSINMKYSAKEISLLRNQNLINFDIAETTDADTGYKFTDEHTEEPEVKIAPQRPLPSLDKIDESDEEGIPEEEIDLDSL